MNDRLLQIKDYVSEKLSCSAHNLDHVLRVYQLSLTLARHESNVDFEILEASVLLHDLARVQEDEDKTGMIDHAILGAELAEEILGKLGYAPDEIAKIKHCIQTHRFRSGREPQTIEAKILFDADKLDVLGAIGIARSFMLAGQYGEPMYQDLTVEEVQQNLGDYGRVKDISKHTTYQEYQTKFKKIPERVYTLKAREIATQRLAFMDGFFRQMKDEVKGKL